MTIENILSHIENTIEHITEDITRKKTAGGDKLDSLAKLANSYRKLLEFAKEEGKPPNPGLPIYANERDEQKILNGDPEYIKALHAHTFGEYKSKLPRKKR